MEEQMLNGEAEVTFNYLKETKIIRYIVSLLLVIEIIVLNPFILALLTPTSPFESTDSFSNVFILLYIVIIFVGIRGIIFINKQKQCIITIGRDRIIVNGRLIDICDINYMGYVGYFRSSYYAIITNDSDEIVIRLSKKCDDYLYQVCKINNIKTDTRRIKSARNDTPLALFGISLLFVPLIIILLLFKLFVPNL
jgi:hypothetical protein